jgi:hypothetical protein
MEQSDSWEGNSNWVSKRDLALVSTLKQTNQCHIVVLYFTFIKIHFNIIFPYMAMSPKKESELEAFLVSPVCEPYTDRLILFDFVRPIFNCNYWWLVT